MIEFVGLDNMFKSSIIDLPIRLLPSMLSLTFLKDANCLIMIFMCVLRVEGYNPIVSSQLARVVDNMLMYLSLMKLLMPAIASCSMLCGSCT